LYVYTVVAKIQLMQSQRQQEDLTQKTLPLFSEAALRSCQQTLSAAPVQDTRSQRQRRRSRVARPGVANPHLIAAKKLSRKIKYLPDHSEAQAETAHAICEHLRLLLSEPHDG
jgi:transposase